MSLPAHQDPAVIERGRAALAEMRSFSRSLHFSTLLTDDGFEVVSAPENPANGGRLASMSSSMQALGDAVARELRLGANEYIIVAAESGYVIQLRVAGQPLVLSALFDDHETLGKALSVSRLTAGRLSSSLAMVSG